MSRPLNAPASRWMPRLLAGALRFVVAAHRRMPSIRLRLVPGAGHMVHHTAPGEVAAAVHEAWRMGSPA